MSKVKISGNASGTGTLTITAPDTDTDRSLTLPDTAGEFVTADASGNVGIGTSSPLSQLMLQKSTGVELRLNPQYEGTDRAWRIKANSWDGAGYPFTISDYTSERMRIDSSGSLLLNQTSFSSGVISVAGDASGARYTIDSSQAAFGSGNITHIRFKNSNGGVGSINTSGSSTSYNTSSDYRLKTDVQPMTGATERLKALKPVNFEWIADGSRTDGFLAHEVSDVVPEAISGEKDAVDDEGNPEYQGIDQSKLVPLLTGALQEAIAKIEALETRIEALENA